MRNRLHQTVAAVALLSILALGAADGVVRLLAERRLEIPYRNGLPDGAREALVTFNGLLLRATGRRMVSGTRHADVLRLDNGQLALCPLARTGRLRRKAVRDIARALAGVRDELARSGTPLVFVLCPSKVPPGGVGLPAGMEDDDNLLADLLVERLGQNGIECLDLRRRIAEEGLDHASLFFRTDHHWTPAAGLWAANETAAFLRDRHGFPADLSRTAPERFESRRIADRFLASVAAYARRPSVPLRAFALSLLFQFLVFVAIWTVGRALRIPVPFAWYCVFAPLVCILEALPVSINGMGLREAAYVVFFGVAFPLVGFAGPEGVPAADWAKTCAGAMALCYMGLTLAYALGGGLLLLRRTFLPARSRASERPCG